ncbi:MAG: RimK/LysX family protein [Legionellales bacterium]|nr:RimK/LysX family protein [Legionellales bacterium]
MRLRTLFFLFWSLYAGHAMAENSKTVYGYIEKATLTQQDLTLSAKLDTGAKTASLNATKITEIRVHGKPYLSFIVPSKEGDIAFQCEYIGKVQIKMRTGENQINTLIRHSVKRPVVLMPIRLAHTEKMIRVNLTNRKRFIYPLLLGREAIIAFDGVIDPSKRYTLPDPNQHETEKASAS